MNSVFLNFIQGKSGIVGKEQFSQRWRVIAINFHLFCVPQAP